MSPPAIFFTLLFEPELIIGLVQGFVRNFPQANAKETSTIMLWVEIGATLPHPLSPTYCSTVYFSSQSAIYLTTASACTLSPLCLETMSPPSPMILSLQIFYTLARGFISDVILEDKKTSDHYC